jgi:hypothetical protein
MFVADLSWDDDNPILELRDVASADPRSTE